MDQSSKNEARLDEDSVTSHQGVLRGAQGLLGWRDCLQPDVATCGGMTRVKVRVGDLAWPEVGAPHRRMLLLSERQVLLWDLLLHRRRQPLLFELLLGWRQRWYRLRSIDNINPLRPSSVTMERNAAP